MIYLLSGYLLLINLDGFLLMASDKSRAKKQKRRVPEAAFFTVAILGGALGVLLGMKLCRHKTLHTSFTVGIPLILFFETILILVLTYLYINA